MNMELRRKSNTPQETVLAEAIERLLAGEDRDSIVISAEADADWLEPLLAAFAAVRDLKQSTPIPPADASLARFLAQGKRAAAEASRRPAVSRWWVSWMSGSSLSMAAFPRLAATAVSSVLLVLAMTLGSALFLGAPSASAAEGILPGQWIYPIKRLGEQVYLSLPQSSQSRSLRMAEYDERRRDEVRGLLNHSIAASVAFRGVVEDLDPSSLVVDGIALQVTGETQVTGPLAVGAQVAVQAHTVAGDGLVAQSLTVEQPAPPTEVPTATPSVQPTATPAPLPTSTPGLIPAEQPSAGTPTDEPPDVLTPLPTAPRKPAAAATDEIERREDHSGPGGGGGQSGKGDSGDDNQGPGSGDDNGGNNQGPGGDDNSGSSNSGSDDSGGDDNSGSDNSGGDDSGGDDNSGSGSSGSDDSGGDDNSGSGNSGSDDSGGADDSGSDDNSGSGSDDDDDH